MERSLEQEIREHLIDYLIDDLSLDEFKVWLSATTWAPIDADPIAIRLANRIKLVLAEHSGSFIDNAEMRDDLLAVLQHSEVKLGSPEPVVVLTGSSSQSVTHRSSYRVATADTALA